MNTMAPGHSPSHEVRQPHCSTFLPSEHPPSSFPSPYATYIGPGEWPLCRPVREWVSHSKSGRRKSQKGSVTPTLPISSSCPNHKWKADLLSPKDDSVMFPRAFALPVWNLPVWNMLPSLCSRLFSSLCWKPHPTSPPRLNASSLGS